jgi:release factor glutamine methyltransferase
MDGERTVSWRELLAETTMLVGDRNEARWLCEEASGERGAGWAEIVDDAATVRSVVQLDAMVARRCAGEPLAYVLGSWAFRRLELMVDRRVLIPRPETELVAGHAIDAARARLRADQPVCVVDLGTGSGAIGLSVAVELPLRSSHVWCTDASSEALDVCRANLAGIGRSGSQVQLAKGSWFDALPSHLRGTIDVVVSNPPYVTTADADLDASVIEWEPGQALFAGPDGLDAYRSIIVGAVDWLAPEGVLVLEIGARQAAAVVALATAEGLRDVAVYPDLAGHDRVVWARTTPARA